VGGNLEMEDHNYLARIIVDTAFHIHHRIGPGLLESVYEAILFDELIRRELVVERQKAVPIVFEGRRFDEGFRADLIVNKCVLLELKSVEKISRAHRKQLLTYLKLTDMRLGLLINFGEYLIKNGIHRIVNGL
jgi:GxxExxY protein